MTQQFPPSSSANAPQLRLRNRFRTHTSQSWVAPFQATSCSFDFLSYFLKQSEANASELHILSLFPFVPNTHITLDSVLRPAVAKNEEG